VVWVVGGVMGRVSRWWSWMGGGQGFDGRMVEGGCA
jgi:hypothetical protein